MFEMFATIVAACAAAIYGLSRSVFMSGVHRNLYRAAFIGIIILVYVTYRIYHYIKFKNIKKLNVDFDDYGEAKGIARKLLKLLRFRHAEALVADRKSVV